ncbi:MAG: chromate transporter [Pyramidobacter sp.]|nr:chromate transporter [Pyramidobacter sp.]
MMTYIALALTFAKVSLLTFGGGLASLPFLYQVFVTERGWLTASVFSETVALAQMTPGPIILNSATLLGYRFGGIASSIVATCAVVLAPLLVVMALVWVFKNASGAARLWVDRIRVAMRPVVAGLLAVALWTVALPVLHRRELWGFAALSALLYFTVPWLRKYPQVLLIGVAVLTAVLYALGMTSLAAA